jgi:hypothetical protein
MSQILPEFHGRMAKRGFPVQVDDRHKMGICHLETRGYDSSVIKRPDSSDISSRA